MASLHEFPLGNKTRSEWEGLCEMNAEVSEHLYLQTFEKVMGSAYRFSTTVKAPDSIVDDERLQKVDELLEQAFVLLCEFKEGR